MDEGIVEGCEDSSDAEDEFALSDLRTKRDVLLSWAGGLFLGRHFDDLRWLSFVKRVRYGFDHRLLCCDCRK